jgi:hypothetical protein
MQSIGAPDVASGKDSGGRGLLAAIESRPYLALTVAWALLIAVINPSGEFALNDDWAYALMVRRFLETGKIEPSSWTYVPCITNVWIGAAAAKLFGASYFVLRCSTLLFGWIGAIGVYTLLRAVGRPIGFSLVLTLVYMLCPVYVNLAFTFMTDTVFSALLTWALVGATWGFQGRPLGFVLALTCTALAVISRQPAVAIVAALAGAVLLRYASTKRRLLLMSLAGALLAGAALFIFDTFLASGRFKVIHILSIALSDQYLRSVVTKEVVTYSVATGLMLGPLLPLLLDWRNPTGRLILLIAAAFTVLCLAVVVRYHCNIPVNSRGNIFGLSGLGPQIVHGGLAPEQLPPMGFRWALFFIGCYSGICILMVTAVALAQRGVVGVVTTPTVVAPLLFCLAYILPIAMRQGFDRYLMPIIPAILTLLPLPPASKISTGRWRFALLWGVASVALSVFGTVDYLNHHRGRMTLVNMAKTELGATAWEIDGGFEYNGDQAYERKLPNIHEQYEAGAMESAADEARFTLALRAGHYGATPPSWGYNDRYLVSMAPEVGGYHVLKEHRYFRWYMLKEESLYLHERNAAAAH